MGWKKEPNVADLTPTAVIVALERDLLLSSLSRPVGSVRGIPSPAAVPKKAPADARAAAEIIALIRRGEFVAALTCPAAKEALIVPATLEGQPAPSPDVDGVSALYASVEAAVESAGAAAAQAGALPKAAHELVILAIGVAALNAFIQANVTGPDCRDAPHCPLTPSASAADLESSAPAWNKWAVKSLTEDGEDLVGRCFLPQYLYLARALLGKRCATRTKEAVGGDDVDVAVATLAETRARAARKQSTSSSGGRVVMWPDENVQPPSLTWWASRAAIAHQRLLSGRSPTLRGQLLGYHALTLCWYVYLGTHILIIARTIRLSNSCFIRRYAPNNAAPGFPSAAAVVKAAGAREASDGSPTPSAAAAAVAGLLASMSLLETALMEHEYGHVDSAKALLKAAGEPIGASHEIVGEMGFRTVHQTDAKAQMVLRAECRGLEMFKRPVVNGPLGGEREETTASDDETDELLAEEAAEAAAKKLAETAERDETGRVVNTKSAAMNRIAIELDGLSADGAQVLIAPRLGVTRADRDAEDTVTKTPLPAAHQALVLASAVTVRKSMADDGTRSWSVAPYHECVQTQARSRPVLRAAAAVLACRHERERARTRERALLVMEDLVKSLEAPAPSAAARIRYAYSAWFPPGAMLRKELGEHLVSLGMVGAALELFEEIELWDSLIVCLTLLGKKQAAADTIRRRLEVDPTDPKLWCALGDALDLEEHFQKALEVSDGKNARAMRSLARRAALREDWTKAAEHWSAAMKINPLFPDGWFSAGYALLKADREDEALSAFVRCTQIDAENGQAWNNVAALNIRKGKFAAAHVALQEAVKQVATSWQTWENLAMVAAKIGRFQQSARALVKVMDLTGGAKLHVATLSTLVERCKEARSGGSGSAPDWLRKESDAEAAEAENTRAKLAVLGGIADIELEGDESDDEVWEGVGGAVASGGGDAGDMADDFLDAFMSDDDDDKADADADAAAEAAKAANADDVRSEVLSREVVRLEAAVDEVLKTALGSSGGERSVKDTADLWALSADLKEARGEFLVANEARLKRIRALETSGWRKDAEAFAEYADASLDMCRGRLRACADAVEDAEVADAKRQLAQARMHMNGVVKASVAGMFDEAMGEVHAELVACMEEVTKAEEGA